MDTCTHTHGHRHIHELTQTWTHLHSHTHGHTQTHGHNPGHTFVDTYSLLHKLVDMYTQTCSRTHPGGHGPGSHLPCLPLPTCLWIFGWTDRSFSRGAGDGLAGDFSRPSGSYGPFSSSTGSAGEKNVECLFPNPPWVPGRTETNPSVCACCQREEGNGQSGRPPISMGHTGPELGMCSRRRGLEDLPQMMPVWTGLVKQQLCFAVYILLPHAFL